MAGRSVAMVPRSSGFIQILQARVIWVRFKAQSTAQTYTHTYLGAELKLIHKAAKLSDIWNLKVYSFIKSIYNQILFWSILSNGIYLQ